MKDLVINKCMFLIKNNCDYDDIKLQEIRYGLASIYLQWTKIIVISLLNILFHSINEFIVFSLLFNFLRKFSFGLHAKKSYQCWISSLILFVCIPLLSKYLIIPLNIKLIICILGIIFMFKNSPADTEKKPIISKKRRDIYKTISVFITIIYSFLVLFLRNQMVVNCLISSIILENILISKTTYKAFDIPYDNYKRWEG